MALFDRYYYWFGLESEQVLKELADTAEKTRMALRCAVCGTRWNASLVSDRVGRDRSAVNRALNDDIVADRHG